MTKINPKQSPKKLFHNLKVRVIRAPLVNNDILNRVLADRQRALVL
jgi:hypothetical protein